jgi:hypothetical protein
LGSLYYNTRADLFIWCMCALFMDVWMDPIYLSGVCMYVCMYGWMDIYVWMDVWICIWMDGWMDMQPVYIYVISSPKIQNLSL